MKNIFILPTNQPSRLAIQLDCKPKYNLQLSKIESDWTDNWEKQHIYIISSEEIKEGVNQWYLDKFLNKPMNSGGAKYSEKQNIIILTTDPILIADGVQAIDDEFLEWFVKNPTCEHVDVYKNWNYPLDKSWEYEIIIPQEEPKQESHICKYCNAETTQPDDECYAKPKQETLEEAAGKYAGKYALSTRHISHIGFEDGANWQAERGQKIVPFDAVDIEVFAIKPDEYGKLFAYIGYKITNGNFEFNVVPFTEPQAERMYSEEEVYELLKTYQSNYSYANNEIGLKKWFEDLKKK
jgi:hypothetical protein